MKILSVDDDPIILDILTQVLASIGQTEVTIAESATQAFEILKLDCVPYDCFLLDIQMPEIDGIQLCAAIRRMPQYRRTPILMITAMSEKAYIDKAFSAGATDYITKPFDIVELGARIRVAEKLVDAQRYKANKIADTRGQRARASTEKPFFLETKLHIDNVDSVIDYVALENYVSQLSRGSLFGSTALAFHISEIDRIFNGISAFDFQCLITDIADAITQVLMYSQVLISYAGNGTFVCVYGNDQKQRYDTLESGLREAISSMELCYSDGRPILFTIVAGEPIRLTFRSGQKVVEALLKARSTAEDSDVEFIRAPRKPSLYNTFLQGLHV